MKFIKKSESNELITERVIRPRKGLARIDFAELWRYRELFDFLTWRDILVCYKQNHLNVRSSMLIKKHFSCDSFCSIITTTEFNSINDD